MYLPSNWIRIVPHHSETYQDDFKTQHELNFNAPHLVHSLLPNNWLLSTMTEHCILYALTIAQICRCTKKASLSHILTLKIINKIQVLFRKLIWPKHCTTQKEKNQMLASISLQSLKQNALNLKKQDLLAQELPMLFLTLVRKLNSNASAWITLCSLHQWLLSRTGKEWLFTGSSKEWSIG